MKRAVIIGAGPAGLTAAFELLKQAPGEYEVILLEADQTVGGISRTVKHNGQRMDIGGHRFFSKNQKITSWWEDRMPLQGAPAVDDKILNREKKLSPGGPDPEKEDRVMLLRQRVSRIYYRKKFFDYPISMKWETFRNMGFGSTVAAGASYVKAALFKRKERSLEDFYVNRFGKVLYSMFFEGYTEKLWGRHPKEISADWGAQRVKGLSVRAVIADTVKKLLGKKDSAKGETSLIEEFSYPKFGPGQLWESVAREIEEMGGKIVFGAEVKSVHADGGKIRRVRYEKEGESHDLEGDVFFSSMPVKDLVGGMNGVPDSMGEIAAGLPYRDFVTVGLLVEKIGLKNRTKIPTLSDIVPDCWIYVQDAGVKLGRIQIFNNWSPYLVKDPRHTVWMGLEYFCNENDKFWNLSEEACVEFASEELKKMGVIASDCRILDSHRERVKKAYPAYFDSYARMDELIGYLDGFENLYCIGRNGQHRYNNMDHSMLTAMEAVDNVLQNKKTKENIWNVNTEKEYHESDQK